MHARFGRGAHSKATLRALGDQVVVITGGSSGIGRETAIRMGRAGARVVVLSRDADGLSNTVDEIVRDGGRGRHIVCDVTDATAVQSAVGLVEEWFGRIDTWVGNAGVLMYAPFADTSPDEFRRMLEVNFIGQIIGIQAVLPALRRAGGGALICVTSTEAVVTLPMHSAYAASKHALEGALDGLRRELLDAKEAIRLTVVRPAVIDTAIYPHARNRMSRAPSAPRPFYAPGVVADAI
ncbi:MAG TPA: SDR family NAD(P)-dependent oxidoreductase, partial [Microbacterium sp.]|nr:SDR family NAD(P)-dependent oxidoreductase [Microbacterium sp.]